MSTLGDGATSEQARLHAALAALRILARKYEFKDEEERSPLGGVVDATFPLLLPIFRCLFRTLSQPLTYQGEG